MGQFAETFQALHVILKGVGDAVPIVGTPMRILGSLANWCGGKNTSANAEERKQIVISLENLLGDLEKTYQTLNKYADEDKKDSRLTFEVKVALKACADWAELIDNKKSVWDSNSTKGLLDQIKAREKSLNFSIQNEVLEQAIRINQKQKVLAAIMKLDKKKPWEYYEDGKYLIGQKNGWMPKQILFIIVTLLKTRHLWQQIQMIMV